MTLHNCINVFIHKCPDVVFLKRICASSSNVHCFINMTQLWRIVHINKFCVRVQLKLTRVDLLRISSYHCIERARRFGFPRTSVCIQRHWYLAHGRHDCNWNTCKYMVDNKHIIDNQTSRSEMFTSNVKSATSYNVSLELWITKTYGLVWHIIFHYLILWKSADVFECYKQNMAEMNSFF